MSILVGISSIFQFDAFVENDRLDTLETMHDFDPSIFTENLIQRVIPIESFKRDTLALKLNPWVFGLCRPWF
jgi:hypothetical protein